VRELPLTIGKIHFIGIGGIGMSGIAEILVNLGYQVQGSDISLNPNVERLRKIGVSINIGHEAKNLAGASLVVISTAVKPSNPELQAARERSIPVVRRAEMLGELMRLKWSIAVGGTHGKTTTTSLVGTILEGAGFDPTVINGGIINAWGSNAKLGNGDWMVCEADESDGSFLKLPAIITIVTNIDPEHLDYYGSFKKLCDAFIAFIQNTPFYGFSALCIDHPNVQSLIEVISDRRLVTFGLSNSASIQATNIRATNKSTSFDVLVTNPKKNRTRTISNINLPMIGNHNVQNTLAAIAVAEEMHVPDAIIKKSLANFSGVKRRFTRVGEVNGVVVIDDYGHHPTEIIAVIKAAKDVAPGRVIAVVQPHRYSRLRDLFKEFCASFDLADIVIVADIYAAGEEAIEGVNKSALANGLCKRGHQAVIELPSPNLLAEVVSSLVTPGDYIVCLGAGDITRWASALPAQLLEIGSNQ